MEEKIGKADKKEIRSRKNQKLYRSRFGKGGRIMKKLEIVIRPESLENLELLLEEQKANGMMITNILGYGNQKGYRQMYRGAEIVVFIAVRYIITILYRVKTIEVLTLIIIRILKLFYQIIIKSKNLIHIFAIAKGKSKMKLKKQLAYRRKNIL